MIPSLCCCAHRCRALVRWKSLGALLWLIAIAPIGIAQLAEDQGRGPALSPQASLSMFHVPADLEWKLILSEPEITQPLMTTYDRHGRLWVVEYRQYPDPAGLKSLSQDKFRRTVYDGVPMPPGQGGVVGADRISIHEDRDHDGVLETHTTFVDGLNIATAVVPTQEGAWVLNPPYLLFYPDADGDLHADGAPQVHLQGFGLEDTHSVVNSLCMGPDGWLYAAQGSTVSGTVKRFGSSEQPLHSLGQAIWRYHPSLHRYEIFAEGGGNAFGVAMNDSGEIFSGHNGGDTRGFHYYQGGYYRKGFSKHGSLSNPHTYGYLMPMKHDPIQRFTHTMLMTDSTTMGASMPNSMLAVDPLHGKLIQTELLPEGATYATRDVRDAVSSDDRWFRPVAIQEGPDGSALVCDWYDFQVAHIYAYDGKMDRDHGRIYALNAKGATGREAPDRSKLVWDATLANGNDARSLEYLVGCLKHPYRWQRWQARWLIARHPLRETWKPALLRELPSMEPTEAAHGDTALEYLWTAHACGWLQDTIPSSGKDAIDLSGLLEHPSANVRAWCVRLACDDGVVDPKLRDTMGELAMRESDSKVLCQIACSARRLEASDAAFLVKKLLSRPLPNGDPFLVSLLWWAVERHAEETEILMNTLVLPEDIWSNTIARTVVMPNLVQRWCRGKTPAMMSAAARLLGRISQLPTEWKSDSSERAQEAFEHAFEGRSLAGVSNSVLDALAALGKPSLTLRLRRGDDEAVREAVRVLKDKAQPEQLRMQLARIASELKSSETLVDPLIAVAMRSDDALTVRSAALASLAAFDAPRIGEAILEAWSTLTKDLQSVAGAVLASRAAWTELWLTACEQKRLDARSMSLEAIRAMRMHDDPALQKRIHALYPEAAGIDFASAQKRAGQVAETVMRESGDPYRGKKLYRDLCSRCHRLFDEGGNIGPDLTGYQRDQLHTLARNIIAPSLEIREGYQTVRALTSDALVLSGFVESQNEDTIVLRGIDGESRSLERSEIERLEPQILSLMPEGLLDPLNDQQLSDLMAYLRSSQPLSDG